MVGKCANNFCSTARHPDHGKLFRLDIELGSRSGKDDECKTEYVWLCDRCAQVLHPKVVVTGNTVTLRLASNSPVPVPTDTDGLWKLAN